MLNPYLKYFIPFVLFVSACTSLPKPPTPADKNASVLGVRVNLKAPIMGGMAPGKVYFVRVDKDKQDPKKGVIVASNYKDGDTFYVLNAKPGYYMLSFFRHAVSINNRGTNRYTTLLSEQAALASMTRVESGKVVFMGDIKIDTTMNKEKSDNYQKYLVGSLRLKNTDVSDVVLKSFNPFSKNINYFIWYGSSQGAGNNMEAKNAFLSDSRKTFEKTAWSSKF